jgi:hypothetical protein
VAVGDIAGLASQYFFARKMDGHEMKKV